MSAITDEPTRRAYAKLRTLSADAEARRLAFVRERALHDEASLLMDAREEGREEGPEEGRDAALRETAMNMICHTALDDTAIAVITGLAVAKIQGLRGGALGKRGQGTGKRGQAQLIPSGEEKAEKRLVEPGPFLMDTMRVSR